jgi:hypothetical protein
MRRALYVLGTAFALVNAAPQETVRRPRPAPQETTEDERPRLRRRPRAEGEFHESFSETSMFKPNSKTADGKLTRVECKGKSARLHIVSGDKPLVFDVLDPKLIILKNADQKEFEFACGPQKHLPVSVEYVETEKMKSVYSLEFKRPETK